LILSGRQLWPKSQNSTNRTSNREILNIAFENVFLGDENRGLCSGVEALQNPGDGLDRFDRLDKIGRSDRVDPQKSANPPSLLASL
jgi:hypothetical protein